MKPILAAMFATLLCASGAASADDVVNVSENRNVDARTVKIRLDGVIDLQIKQGPTAALTIVGDKRAVAKVTVTQSGDTLQIGTDTHNGHGSFNIGRHQLRAELTLPALRELSSDGVGETTMNGFRGDDLKLALNGAGAVTINGQFKHLDARLGGVGSMTINGGNSDSVDLNLHGAGKISASGQSKMLHAKLGGVGSLDAQQLRADAVELDMTGLGGATVYAKDSANLKLSGLGSATVYGKPANRASTARGLGSVSWE